MNAERKVHIKSFGCQMNVYDSHRMADTLAPEGFTETARVEDAVLAWFSVHSGPFDRCARG